MKIYVMRNVGHIKNTIVANINLIVKILDTN